MRTDMLKLSLLLAGAALLAAAPPAAAQEEEIREAAAVEEEARQAAERARSGVRGIAGGGAHVVTGDHVVARGEVVEGDMVVAGGDLLVEGEIRGNAVVTGGDLTLVEGATVLGDAVVTGGQIRNDGGRVLGEMRTVAGGRVRARPSAAAAPEPPARPRVRVEREHRREAWFAPIARGINDIVSTLALGVVLGLIGVGLVFYGLPYLRTVSETLRKSTGRSAAVGLAATFLVVPVFILLIVALAVTIVGIPLLLVAVPLYPVLVIGAFGFGLVAAAHAIGERTTEQRTDIHFRHRNAYAYIFYGLAILLAPLLMAGVVEMVGFLDWVAVLLKVVGILALWVVATVGMGAVILSRAGTRKTFARDYPSALEDDALFDSEPVVR